MAAVWAGGLSACVDLAPRYTRPDAPVSAAWPAPALAASAGQPAAETAWQDVVLDARLRRVIEAAVANNRDLRIAVLNIEQARAQYRIQNATTVPSLSGSGSLTRASSAGVATNAASVSVATSSFEVDLFGRVKNNNAAALQAWLATTEGARAAQISLVAAVATQWLTLAADMQSLQLSERLLELDERSLELNRRLHELGAIKGLPVTQAQAALEQTRGTVAAGRTILMQDRHALDLLVGQPVPDAWWPAGRLPDETAVLVGVPAGLPSDVLQQRPDVLAAEHALQQAQLQIGAARAAFFPTISLTGSAGTGSTALSGLFKSGSGAWSFGPAITLPLFDGGARQADLDSVTAGRDIALASYDKAVQTAFREVADALAVRALLAERIAAQQAQTGASERSLRDATALFRNGSVSYLEVLTAQRGLYASQQSEITLDLIDKSNRIALYKALGGGWKASN